MRIKKNTLWLIAIVIVVVIAGNFLLTSPGSAVFSSTNNNELNANADNTVASGEVQIVKLSVSGSNYILEPSTVKKGIPVRIEADINKMPGCSKSVVLSAFGVQKTVSASDNKIEFTPDKAGTFTIVCSMNMYQGKLTVLESDGTKVNYVQTSAPSTGKGCSMGQGGGGCGCGG